ncbi:MAG: hypothetical protein EOP48_06345 [Sphingobacteriales bacterium]|nr:MAG: hypothetical protein EOP48_06345 [Sphingobacteriales bacterium]
MIHAAVNISATGCISIHYKFVDILDLRPERGGKVYFGGKGNSPFSKGEGTRPWQYNAASSIFGIPYHDILGGNDKMKVKVTWTSER